MYAHVYVCMHLYISALSTASFPWLFRLYGVVGLTDDIPTPCHPVYLFDRSLSATINVFPSLLGHSLFRSLGISVINTFLGMRSSSLLLRKYYI